MAKKSKFNILHPYQTDKNDLAKFIYPESGEVRYLNREVRVVPLLRATIKVLSYYFTIERPDNPVIYVPNNIKTILTSLNKRLDIRYYFKHNNLPQYEADSRNGSKNKLEVKP